MSKQDIDELWARVRAVERDLAGLREDHIRLMARVDRLEASVFGKEAP